MSRNLEPDHAEPESGGLVHPVCDCTQSADGGAAGRREIVIAATASGTASGRSGCSAAQFHEAGSQIHRFIAK